MPWGFGTTTTAYDLTRKKTLWTHREEARIDSRAMVIGGLLLLVVLAAAAVT